MKKRNHSYIIYPALTGIEKYMCRENVLTSKAFLQRVRCLFKLTSKPKKARNYDAIESLGKRNYTASVSLYKMPNSGL